MRMAEYISKEYLLDALSVFRDTEYGNPHFLSGIATAKEIVENAPIECADKGERDRVDGYEAVHDLISRDKLLSEIARTRAMLNGDVPPKKLTVNDVLGCIRQAPAVAVLGEKRCAWR